MKNNEKTKIGSAGGIATAKILREKAIKNYYENPKKCEYCYEIIHVFDKDIIRDVKNKRFCNRVCFGKFMSNKYKEVKKQNPPKVKQIIKKENSLITRRISNKSLGEISSNRNYFSVRSTITKNARYVYTNYNKDKKCKICDYSLHVEVCHIKAVKDFTLEAKISEINSPTNLIYLCPNHHWEFDNGYLSLS